MKNTYEYIKGNELEKDRKYCYVGHTTPQKCKCKGNIYKDTKMNAFCLKCGTSTEF